MIDALQARQSGHEPEVLPLPNLAGYLPRLWPPRNWPGVGSNPATRLTAPRPSRRASWGSSAAFAAGSDVINTCTPSCVAGHFLSFPVLAALWRAEPWPGHAGESYFTRLTIIYTGSLSYTVGGKVYHLPPTATYPLSQYGGA